MKRIDKPHSVAEARRRRRQRRQRTKWHNLPWCVIYHTFLILTCLVML